MGGVLRGTHETIQRSEEGWIMNFGIRYQVKPITIDGRTVYYLEAWDDSERFIQNYQVDSAEELSRIIIGITNAYRRSRK